MKRYCLLMGTLVLAFLTLAGIPGLAQDDAPDWTSDGVTDTLSGAGGEMVYDQLNGRLLYWTGPSGEVVLDYDSAETPAPADDAAGEAKGAATVTTITNLPMRLYLFRRIAQADPNEADPFVNQRSIICQISDTDTVDADYTRTLQGNEWHQVWTVRALYGTVAFEHPTVAGAYQNRAASTGECTFLPVAPSDHVLTIEAYTS